MWIVAVYAKNKRKLYEKYFRTNEAAVEFADELEANGLDCIISKAINYVVI